MTWLRRRWVRGPKLPDVTALPNRSIVCRGAHLSAVVIKTNILDTPDGLQAQVVWGCSACSATWAEASNLSER